MPAIHEKTIILGPEYDERLRAALREVIVQLGGSSRKHDWGAAGSQEVEIIEANVEGHRLVVEAETYVGLSISGPAELVDRIRDMVQQLLSRRDPG